tara:strand:- start:55 stop:501 length:447 start_codon:yes stop_codon:yes gene_type:complete
MRLVIQRVTEANVTVKNRLISQINNGLLVLVGIDRYDTASDIIYGAKKIANLKLTPTGKQEFGNSILELGQPILLVSEFTLLARTSKGSKLSFSKAAEKATAKKLFDELQEELKSLGIDVKTGVFGAEMQVASINNGPVTIWIDTKNT